MTDRSIQRVDRLDGEFQVQVLCEIGLLVRTDDVVWMPARNGLGNGSKSGLVANELHTSTQEGRRNVYPKRA